MLGRDVYRLCCKLEISGIMMDISEGITRDVHYSVQTWTEPKTGMDRIGPRDFGPILGHAFCPARPFGLI